MEQARTNGNESPIRQTCSSTQADEILQAVQQVRAKDNNRTRRQELSELMKWEYKILRESESTSLDNLNELGQEGWQLAAMTPNYSFVFKRPIEEEGEANCIHQNKGLCAVCADPKSFGY